VYLPNSVPNDRDTPALLPNSRSACLSAAFSWRARLPTRLFLCQKSSNAGHVGTTQDRFRITHPFHPLRGTEYELVTRKFNWGEDRVFYYDQLGALKSFTTNVTDLITADDFARISAGRSAFRLDDLLELRALLDRRQRTDRRARDA
jgi:hypothetical protein